MNVNFSSDRLLVIGLDMGDAALIEKWSREGLLPTLRSFLAEGAWRRLKTTAGALHTSTWPTIFTGTLPGKHGVYYPYQIWPGEQQARHIGANQYGAQPFWQILDRAGKRCVILDAPETFPVKEFQGVQIFEWGTWAWYWKRMATPVDIETQLAKRFGRYPLKWEAKRLGLKMPSLARLHRQLLASAAQKAQIARWLMHSRAWDFFLIVFGELHPAGHYLWPRSAPSAGEPTSVLSDSSTSRLRDIYVAVDAAIGEVLKECGGDTTVLIISGDGVGPNHCAWQLLPEILYRSGFTKTYSDTSSGNGRSPKPFLRSLRDVAPPWARSVISACLPWRLRDRLVSQVATANVDWSKTRAFTLPTDLEGCIRINLRGREPQGIVEPGSEYQEVCSELIEVMRQLINPATGRAAVHQVRRIDDLFPGDRRHHLPDLTVVWNREAEIREIYSDRLGLLTSSPVDPRTGTHYPLSFLAAKGPQCRTEIMPHQVGHIADLAPTILAHFWIKAPADMDGQVLGGIQ